MMLGIYLGACTPPPLGDAESVSSEPDDAHQTIVARLQQLYDCSRVITQGGNLQAAIDQAEAGETICVAAGRYHTGVLQIRRSDITLRAVGDVDVLGFDIDGNNIRIDGFHISNSASASLYPTTAIFAKGDKIDIANNRIASRNVRRGVQCDPCTNSSIRNNVIEQVQNYGIWVEGGRDNLITHNNIHSLVNLTGEGDVDGIRFFGEGHVFSYNYIHDINEFASKRMSNGDTPHADCFQTYSAFKKYNPISGPIATKNVEIVGNYCVRVSRQCLIVQTSKSDGITGPVPEDIVFRSNVCETYDNQTINLGGSTRARIENNYLGSKSRFHVIYLGEGPGGDLNRDTIIRNNFLTRPSSNVNFVGGNNHVGTAYQGNIEYTGSSPVSGSASFQDTPKQRYPERVATDASDVANFLRTKNVTDRGVALETNSRFDVSGRPRLYGGDVDVGPYEAL